jgi:hypothetical protein
VTAPDADASSDLRALAGLLRSRAAVVEVVVDGLSMEPTFGPSATVRIACTGDVDARAGAVVAFLAGGRTLTVHRVVRRFHRGRASAFLLTRGDANALCDPPILVGDVLGVVDRWRCGDGAWRDVPRLPPIASRGRRLVRSAHAELTAAALRVHVRVAQACVLAGLGAMAPFVAMRSGAWPNVPPVLRMLHLRRPAPAGAHRATRDPRSTAS